MRLRRWALACVLSLLGGCADEECTERAGGFCAEPSAPVFRGLSADVEVLRDEQRVVHLFGATDADVTYASGYMQAFDRLFQMDLMRRQALGRRAEILGEGAAYDDALVRRLGIPGWGKLNAETMLKESPEDYALVLAWTAGINARIDEVTSGKAPLPYGFGEGELNYMPEHWDVSDAFTVGKLILFGNANLIEYELLATILDAYVPVSKVIPVAQPLVPTYILPPDERPGAGSAAHVKGPALAPTLPPDSAQKLRDFFGKMRDFRPAASNNWAIDGRFTDNGRPIIAGDPHQGLRSPSLMWAHHMNSKDQGGHLNVVGFSFVGTPSVELGHNDHLAWTATTNYPDTMDLWEVPSDGDTVEVGGATITLQKRSEVIAVRDGESQTLIVEEVPGYGVLLPVDIAPLPVTKPGNRLLFGWAGFRPTHEAAAFQAFDVASTLEDFEAAVDSMEIGNFNFVAATADGISYRSSPLIPDRKSPLEKPPFRVLDGSDPDTLWPDAYYGLERLPHSRAEGRGWIVSANNDPFGFTSDGAITGDAFYFGVFFDPGTRAARIESEIARLAGEGAISPEQIQVLQTDTHSVLADFLVPLSQTAAAAVGVDPTLSSYVGRGDLQELATRLGAWDRSMLRSSPDALVFEAYAHYLTKRAVGDDFGVAFDAISEEQPIYMMKLAALTLTGGYPGSEAYAQEGVNALVMAALEDTAAFLTSKFSGIHPSLYTWGDFHGTYFGSLWGDALDGGWVSTDGGDGTVNVSTAPFFRGGNVVDRLESGSGAIYRMVTHFDDDGVPSAEVNFPRGNVGDPDSPFYDNTLSDWVAGRYRPLHFRTDDVVAATVEKMVLSP